MLSFYGWTWASLIGTIPINCILLWTDGVENTWSDRINVLCQNTWYSHFSMHISLITIHLSLLPIHFYIYFSLSPSLFFLCTTPFHFSLIPRPKPKTSINLGRREYVMCNILFYLPYKDFNFGGSLHF